MGGSKVIPQDTKLPLLQDILKTGHTAKTWSSQQNVLPTKQKMDNHVTPQPAKGDRTGIIGPQTLQIGVKSAEEHALDRETAKIMEQYRGVDSPQHDTEGYVRDALKEMRNMPEEERSRVYDNVDKELENRFPVLNEEDQKQLVPLLKKALENLKPSPDSKAVTSEIDKFLKNRDPATQETIRNLFNALPSTERGLVYNEIKNLNIKDMESVLRLYASIRNSPEPTAADDKSRLTQLSAGLRALNIEGDKVALNLNLRKIFIMHSE